MLPSWQGWGCAHQSCSQRLLWRWHFLAVSAYSIAASVLLVVDSPLDRIQKSFLHSGEKPSKCKSWPSLQGWGCSHISAALASVAQVCHDPCLTSCGMPVCLGRRASPACKAGAVLIRAALVAVAQALDDLLYCWLRQDAHAPSLQPLQLIKDRQNAVRHSRRSQSCTNLLVTHSCLQQWCACKEHKRQITPGVWAVTRGSYASRCPSGGPAVHGVNRIMLVSIMSTGNT